MHVQHAYKHQIVYTGSLKLQSINRWYYRIEHLSWIECYSLRYSQDTGYVNKYLFLHIPVIPMNAKLFLINIISSYLHQFVYSLMFINDESTKIYNVYLINATKINIASICFNPCILIIYTCDVILLFLFFLWSYRLKKYVCHAILYNVFILPFKRMQIWYSFWNSIYITI